MSKNAADSLQNFSLKKKKFSFSKQNENVSEPSSDSGEDFVPKLKGSAKLKKRYSSSSESESEDENPKDLNKKILDSDTDEETKYKRDKNLAKLYEMFFDESTEKIQKLFISQQYNAKKCIDILLNENKDKKDDSLVIEEWSDGDEKIRAKNQQVREAARLSSESNKSSESSSSTVQSKKRKLLPAINPVKLTNKKRKVIIDSESDSETKSNGSRELSDKSLSDKETKKKAKKKLLIKLSSDEEKVAKSSVKIEKKKHKKSKEKKSKREKEQRDQSGSDLSGEEYDQNHYSDDSDSDAEEKLSQDQCTEVFNLINKASPEDIQSIINISPKRLELLISLRPFRSFAHLEKVLEQKNLTNAFKSIKEIIYARSIVSTLLNKCVKLSQNMEKKVTSLIEFNDVNSSKNQLEIKFQPKLLNKSMSLKPYQLIGLNWLCLLHKEKINGILADEMGLGKTCQTIAFLTHLLETNNTCMNLIVVPPSTLDNWVREISMWSPSLYFTVYQGSIEERRHLRYNILNNKFEKPLNAILSTYNLLNSTNEDKAFFKKLKFDYCIYDEAHMLKNMNSLRYQSLVRLRSKHRLLLTGTPLQNNLVELMSLLYFVMPDIFDHKTQYVNKIFASKPSNIDTDTFYSEKIAQAKGIMKPFILRRVKNDVLKHLPKKYEEIIFCDMTIHQEKEYSNLITYYKKRQDLLAIEASEKAQALNDKMNKVSAKYADEVFDIVQTDIKNKREKDNEKKDKENGDNFCNIIMELRKAANHPLLRRSLYTDEKLKQMAKLIIKESSPGTVFDYVLEDMKIMSDFELHKLCPLYSCLKGFELSNKTILDSGKFTVLSSILEEKKEMGGRCLIFSQFVIMLDVMEEFLKIKNYKYLRLDGSTAVNDRLDLIDRFNQDSQLLVFLLSTKAGGVGINLTAANTVIMHDIDYNPFNDKQAEDRCHRLGQTREVTVYKLLSKDTIDETMLKIQKKKLELGADISGTSDDTDTKSSMVSMLKEALKL